MQLHILYTCSWPSGTSGYACVSLGAAAGHLPHEDASSWTATSQELQQQLQNPALT